MFSKTSFRSFSVLVLFVVSGSSPVLGQLPPLPEAGRKQKSRNQKDGEQRTLPRHPDDQIEGTIWEYKGTLKGKPKEGEEPPKLEGRFRTEGKAIFDISKRLPIPTKEEVKKVVAKAKEGKLPELKLPPEPQAKRLGQYRKIDSKKWRLDFDDKDSLNGIMLIWLKKDTTDVWMGTYTEKKDNKTVREWQIEIRPIED